MRKAMILLLLVAMTGAAAAQHTPLTNFTYFTESEYSVDDEQIWFFGSTVIGGRMHSNDDLCFRGGRYGRATSAGQIWVQGDTEFSDGYSSNQDSIEFDMNSRAMRSGGRHISSNNGQLMTWIKLRGDQGIDVYQYPLGGIPSDSLLFHMAPPGWACLWIDGEVEVEGILEGQLSIGSSGNMWLIDDITYIGADQHGGFEEDGMNTMLGLMSERNIIIQDNLKNGKQDGLEVEPNNLNRHSIVIDAALCALGESFTFEHQNNDGDLYQGSDPDERGIVYVKGCVIQRRRGYMHVSNHFGTGYTINYSYDSRLEHIIPPGFSSGGPRYIEGRHERLELLQGNYEFGAATIGTLIIEPGSQINVYSSTGFTVTDSLVLNGTEAEPIVITGDLVEPILAGGYNSSKSVITGVQSSEGVSWSFERGDHIVRTSTFEGEMTFGGDVLIDSCSFTERVKFIHAGEVTVSRSLFDGGVLATIINSVAILRNCTIINASRAGVETQNTEQFTLVNCIIANNRWGVLSSGLNDPVIRYCNVAGNRVDDYVDCAAGEGSFSEDPGFVDARLKDYHLTGNSPCIDSGDPASPRDPDGTRADVGTYYFDHALGIKDCGLRTAEWGIDAAPNPFNNQTSLTIKTPQAGSVRIVVYDLSGRVQVELLKTQVEGGRVTVALDASDWPAGVYLATLQAGSEFRSVKIVKLN